MKLVLLNILLTLLFTNNSNINISDYLKQELSDYSRFEYSVISPKNLDLSTCEIDDSRQFKISGNLAYLPIKYSVDQQSRNSLLTLRMKLYKNVLVASRAIGKREYLNNGDFSISEKEVSSLRYKAIDENAQVALYRSRLNISENTVLQTSMLERIPEIETGDRVEAIFTNYSVNISFKVTARTEGATGSIIKVKRDDKKIFKAKVINNTTVKIIE